MKINKDMKIDHLTDIRNFVGFFTDDYKEVYGQYGTLLYIKYKPLRWVNEHYGRDKGDQILKLIGHFIKTEIPYQSYRHEGNAFLVVYKEEEPSASSWHSQKLRKLVSEWSDKNQVEQADLVTLNISYKEPLYTIADYYQLLYDTLLQSDEYASEKDLLHKILENVSYRINHLISSYIDVRSFALHDDISNLPNSKSAKIYLDSIDDSEDDYSVLFIDGDSLSRFNQISYDKGNEAIRKIAGIINQSIRKTDKVFRWLSGDEFIVIASAISEDHLIDLAERIRTNVEKHYEKEDIHATVSIGISRYPHHGDNIDAVLAKAELANKEAKALGKNRYVIYNQSV